MYKQPKISICVPIHDMKDGDKFLWRLVNSLTEQTFKDWELIITKDGKMAENTNAGIKRARGEYIKILYLDDYFLHPLVLQQIVDELTEDIDWMVVGTDDNTQPYFTYDIETGNNKLGSPSALVIKNDRPILFDEYVSWLLDADLYKRMYERFGEPKILEGRYVGIGRGEHQMTHILTNEEKLAEHKYMKQKYEK